MISFLFNRMDSKRKALPYSASERITLSTLVAQYDPENQISNASRSAGHRESVARKWEKILLAFNASVQREPSSLAQIKTLLQKIKEDHR